MEDNALEYLVIDALGKKGFPFNSHKLHYFHLYEFVSCTKIDKV